MFISLRERHALTPDADLLPSPALMRRLGAADLETWFGRGRDWRVVLAAYGGLSPSSWLMEIGPGLGQNAFALRDVFSRQGHYHGMGPDAAVASELEETFAAKYPRFRFSSTAMKGAGDYVVPFQFSEGTYHLIFSADAFTRVMPDGLVALFAECGRILKPGGRLLAAMPVLDNFQPGARRPEPFATPGFEFGAPSADGVALSRGRVALSATRLAQVAAEAGLEMALAPVPGRWSGSAAGVGDLDLVVLQKPR